MSEKHQNIDIDELISLTIDGEASERQQTQLKRLMRHDPSIAERMEALRRQQQILNTLPVESAPASMADDIRAALERKLILADSGRSQSVLASGHLVARRLMTAAAMILLPLGLLALVVFQIMKPPADGPADYTSTRPIATNTDRPPAPGAEQTGDISKLPFKGTLVFRTDAAVTASGIIKEVIEKQGLLGQTFPARTADVMRFEITASPKQVAELVDALAAVRPQCEAVVLQVQSSETGGDFIEIPDIESKQLKMLVYEDSPSMFARLATRYAAANRRDNPLFEENLPPDGYPEPSIPTLAGTYDAANRTVELTIQVERTGQ